MTFPSAAKGIKKVFTAEILSLIGTIALGIAAVLAVVFASTAQAGSNAGAAASGLGFLVLAIGGLVVMLIGLIFKLIGIIQTAKDDAFFRGVIYLTIVSLVFTVIAECFLTYNVVVYNICSSIASICNFIGMLFIILGIGNMAAQLNKLEVVAKCGTLFKVILWIGIITLLARFFTIFMPSVAAQAIVVTLGVISIILSIVQYIIYLTLLSDAKKMLAEN